MSEQKEKFTPGPWRFWRHVNEKYPEMSQTAVFGTGDKKFVMIAQTHDDCAAAPEQTVEEVIANARLISAAPEMYAALKEICEDCEKLSNWEDMFNIGRPEGSIMPKCPCDECHVKEVLLKADGEAFQEVKKRRRAIDTALKMYDKLEEWEKTLRPLFPILADDIEKLLKKARGEE